MSVSLSAPCDQERVNYPGGITYIKSFHSESHNREYGTSINSEKECPILHESLENRAVIFHDKGGEKHPIDADAFIEWVNQRPICPSCTRKIDASRFFKPFERSIELKVKFLEYAPPLSLMSGMISAGALYMSGSMSLSDCGLLAVPAGLSFVGGVAGTLIRQRCVYPDNINLNSFVISTAVGTAFNTLALYAVTTEGLMTSSIEATFSAVKSFFG
jgi:hypothetical protein